MRINTVLLWVTYISLGMLLGLILMILHGSIGFDSEWVQPSTVATLIGGLGGALAGTWLSGRNASHQWEKQKQIERTEKRHIFNKMVEQSVLQILLSHPSIRGIDVTIHLLSKLKIIKGDEEIPTLDEMEEEDRMNEIYSTIEKDMESFYMELEHLYKSIDDMIKAGIADWETFSAISYLKLAFNQTKDISSVKKIAHSLELDDEELRKRILETEYETEDLQHYRDVFNSRRELYELQKLTINTMQLLKNFSSDLSHKVN